MNAKNKLEPGLLCITQSYPGGFKTPPLFGRIVSILKQNKDGCYYIKDTLSDERASVPKSGLVVVGKFDEDDYPEITEEDIACSRFRIAGIPVTKEEWQTAVRKHLQAVKK